MSTATTIRPIGPRDRAGGEIRSALIADIVAGELLGPVTSDSWRRLGTRYEASPATLRLAAIELHELGLLTVDGSRVRVSEQESWRLFAPAVFRELDQPRGRDAIAAYMDARRFFEAELSAQAARRRGARDIVQLSQALRSFSAAARTSGQPHLRLRSHRAADERLRRTIARASHNRYLAAVSARLRRPMQDADWMTKRALACPVAASLVNALIDAVRRGDVEPASDAAQAEIDLIESWAWRRLADRGHRR